MGYVGELRSLAKLIKGTQEALVDPADREKMISAHEYVDTFRLLKMPGDRKLALIWAHADHSTRVILPHDSIPEIAFKGEYELSEALRKEVQNLKKCIAFKFQFSIISR